ncbi:response regulator, partial [uncultured Flavobacterium sp.]|uniref:response regulator n=1 Tax=uncultured Flavobacterium sp. TaxID=165435 RepID=UPI0025DF48E9
MKQVLIIDDHAPIIEGYKNMLSFNMEEHALKFEEAKNCETAYILIIDQNLFFDVIYVDISLPPYEKMEINSGEDLIPFIKKYKPESKIIIVTSHTEHFVLYKIFQKLKPQGILIKSDFTPAEFSTAFSEIIAGKEYYSQTIKEAIKKITSPDFYLDNIDMQIIALLSKGIKSKNLIDHLPLGISTIDKRKLRIKDFFFIEKGNDEDIIR